MLNLTLSMSLIIIFLKRFGLYTNADSESLEESLIRSFCCDDSGDHWEIKGIIELDDEDKHDWVWNWDISSHKFGFELLVSNDSAGFTSLDLQKYNQLVF